MQKEAKIIMVTGGAGYIGSALTEALLEKGYQVKVLDRLFFGLDPVVNCLLNPKFEVIKEDIRSAAPNLFEGVDSVLHLAAISNDPACELDPDVTIGINYKGAMRTARLAKNAGVRRFVFASSCSVYGSGEGSSLTEESTPRPISLYARTKLMAENDLLSLADGNFSVTILRNSTVYGLSRRMRFDLIVNLMALCAFKYKKIRVMGGGRQWRPNVHLSDVIAAFVKIIEADDKKINGQILNVGSSEQNYKVVDIAYMVNNFFPEVEIEYVFSDLDRRNYNVNFDKIKRILGYSVTKTVGDGIQEIKEALLNGFVSDSIMTRTLDYYKHFIEVNKVL